MISAVSFRAEPGFEEAAIFGGISDFNSGLREGCYQAKSRWPMLPVISARNADWHVSPDPDDRHQGLPGI
jgi:hypothetical protein